MKKAKKSKKATKNFDETGSSFARVGVSTELSWAVIFGADTFVGRNFTDQIIDNQIGVLTIGKDKKKITAEKKEGVIVSDEDAWVELLPSKVDYVVDFGFHKEAIKLAVDQQARLLTVINLEAEGGGVESRDKPNDWRLVRTGFVYGPSDDPAHPSLINKLLAEAVLNEPLRIPFSDKGVLYPIFIDDLCKGLLRVLFLPGAEGKEIILLGKPVSLMDFLKYVEAQAQSTNGVLIDPGRALPRIEDEGLIDESAHAINWTAETSWEEGIPKTVQLLFQSKEKGEFKPMIAEDEPKTVPFAPEGGHGFQGKKEAAENEQDNPSLPVIDNKYWDESTTLVKKKPHKLKKRGKKSTASELKDNTQNDDQEKLLVIEETVSEKSDVDEVPEDERKSFALEDKLSRFESHDADVQAEASTLKKENLKPSESSRRWLSIGKKKTLPKKNLFGLLLLSLLLVAIFWFSPYVVAAFNLTTGYFRLRKSATFLGAQRFTEAKQTSQEATRHFLVAKSLAIERGSYTLYRLADLGSRVGIIAEVSTDMGRRALTLGQGILQGSDVDIAQEETSLMEEAEELVWQLGLLQSNLSGRWGWLPKVWQNQLLAYREKAQKTRTALSEAARIMPRLDWILGLNNAGAPEQRKFLVLLQNNMELRPTGGFIGSYAQVTFKGGRLTDFEVKDVYIADGQLKGHVDPPLPLKEILGEDGWFLRNSNWDPNFPGSANTAAWFFEKETGVQVDGVVAFNLAAAQKIVESLGEIYLPDFNEKISSANLFERAEFYSETNFFPGSVQKMSFLSSLGKQLFETVKSASPAQYLGVANATYQSLKEREIMLWTGNEAVNLSLATNNWEGKIKEVGTDAPGNFNDYLFLVEANLGINKANYFLRRSIEKAVTIDMDGKVSQVIKINYENTAQNTTWPGGNYKNYLRVYLPLQTAVNSIYVYDPLEEKSAENTEALASDKLKQAIENGKELVGFLVEVPISSRRTVEIRITQKANLSGDSFKYLFYLQKQSGFGSTPVTVLVSYPEGFKPLQVTPEAIVSESGVVFNQQLDQDIPFGVELSR